jgi:hypothetical protein
MDVDTMRFGLRECLGRKICCNKRGSATGEQLATAHGPRYKLFIAATTDRRQSVFGRLQHRYLPEPGSAGRRFLIGSRFWFAGVKPSFAYDFRCPIYPTEYRFIGPSNCYPAARRLLTIASTVSGQQFNVLNRLPKSLQGKAKQALQKHLDGRDQEGHR